MGKIPNRDLCRSSGDMLSTHSEMMTDSAVLGD